MENSIADPIADKRRIIPYAKGKKTITFYDTFVEWDDHVVKYDDIAIFQSNAMNSSSMIYFYFSKSFEYNFTFTTYDKEKHRFHRHGYSGYGIGTYKRIKEEYETVAGPMYEIVLKAVAIRLIEAVANGKKANIMGLEISKDQIVYEKRKKTIVIDRNNFDRAVNNNGMTNTAMIYVKDEKKPVFSCPLSGDNARLIVPVVNYFFS